MRREPAAQLEEPPGSRGEKRRALAKSLGQAVAGETRHCGYSRESGIHGGKKHSFRRCLPWGPAFAGTTPRNNPQGYVQIVRRFSPQFGGILGVQVRQEGTRWNIANFNSGWRNCWRK